MAFDAITGDDFIKKNIVLEMFRILPKIEAKKELPISRKLMFVACLEGLEPPTYWFVASHSIQLSYRHIYRTKIIISQNASLVKPFFKFFQKIFSHGKTAMHRLKTESQTGGAVWEPSVCV